MNTTQTQKGEQLISIKINVVKDDYEPQVKKELNKLKLKQKAQVPGFRPGMVPFGMIKKMYGAQATIEVLNTLVSETLNNYIVENKLDLIGFPLSDPDTPRAAVNYPICLHVPRALSLGVTTARA